MKYRIFVSHVPSDIHIGSAIRTAFEVAKTSCKCSATSSESEETCFRMIDKSDAMVLVLSESVKGSERLSREVERAAIKGKPIITLRTNNAPLPKQLEYYLSTQHWFDASSQPVEAQANQLTLSVHHLMMQLRAPASRTSKAAALLGVLGALLISMACG